MRRASLEMPTRAVPQVNQFCRTSALNHEFNSTYGDTTVIHIITCGSKQSRERKAGCQVLRRMLVVLQAAAEQGGRRADGWVLSAAASHAIVVWASVQLSGCRMGGAQGCVGWPQH